MNVLVYDPDPFTEPQYEWFYREYLRQYPQIIHAWMHERGIRYRLGPRRRAVVPGLNMDFHLPVREVIFKNPADELRHGEEFNEMLRRDISIKDSSMCHMLFRMYILKQGAGMYLLDSE